MGSDGFNRAMRGLRQGFPLHRRSQISPSQDLAGQLPPSPRATEPPAYQGICGGLLSLIRLSLSGFMLLCFLWFSSEK